MMVHYESPTVIEQGWYITSHPLSSNKYGTLRVNCFHMELFIHGTDYIFSFLFLMNLGTIAE